jgi:hypothetical protein
MTDDSLGGQGFGGDRRADPGWRRCEDVEGWVMGADRTAGAGLSPS